MSMSLSALLRRLDEERVPFDYETERLTRADLAKALGQAGLRKLANGSTGTGAGAKAPQTHSG